MILQIYVNEELHYTNGYSVTVTPKDAVKWYSPGDNMIHVEHDMNKLKLGATITVHIVPH